MSSKQSLVPLRRQELVTKSIPTQEQSVETVQVMLYSSISMLCRLRNIFHASAYDNTDFSEDDDLYTLDGLVTGQQPLRAQSTSPSSAITRYSEPNVLTVPLLKKERSERVNQWLSMLDTVFEALHRKALHSFRIGIVSNPCPDESPLEEYNFGIRYKASPSGDREIAGLQTTIRNEQPFDEDLNVQSCIMNLLGRLRDLCIDLPPLPNNRFMKATIRYMDDEWEPRHFVEEVQPAASVVGFKGWQVRHTDLGLSSGGFHDVSLRVASLRHEFSSTRRMSQDIELDGVAHKQRDSPQLGNMAQNIGRRRSAGKMTSASLRASTSSQRSKVPETPLRIAEAQRDSAPSSRSNGQSTVISSTNIYGSNGAALEDFDLQNPVTPNRSIDESPVEDERPDIDVPGESHLTDDLQLKNALHGMMQSSPIIEGTFGTQPRANASQASNDGGLSTNTLANHMALYSVLSHEKALQLWHKMPELRKRTDLLEEDLETSPLNCQCRLEDSTGELMQCNICETKQHLVCQGFLKGDSRLPDIYVCCHCLLSHEADEAAYTEQLHTLALKRRAMDLLLSEQVEDEVNLARRLGMQPDEVEALREQMTSDGYIVEQGRRRTRNSQAKIMIPSSPNTTAYLDRLERLFDPHRGLEAHYSIPTAAASNSANFQQLLIAKYPLLERIPSKPTTNTPTKRRRAATASLGNGKSSNAKRNAPKRSRTSQADSSTMNGDIATPRRTLEVIRVTPRMRESHFEFFIDGQALPSRNNSAVKSIPFRRE